MEINVKRVNDVQNVALAHTENTLTLDRISYGKARGASPTRASCAMVIRRDARAIK